MIAEIIKATAECNSLLARQPLFERDVQLNYSKKQSLQVEALLASTDDSGNIFE